MTKNLFGAVIAGIVLYALFFYTKWVLAILILCGVVYLVLALLAAVVEIVKRPRA
jgi:hypothetical protein